MACNDVAVQVSCCAKGVSTGEGHVGNHDPRLLLSGELAAV